MSTHYCTNPDCEVDQCGSDQCSNCGGPTSLVVTEALKVDATQPTRLSFDKSSGKHTPLPPERRHLNLERKSITHKFRVEGHKGYITVGLFEDGTPGELFIKMSKQGSTMSGMSDSFATMTSLALQWGVPIKQLCRKFVGVRFVPQGHTGNPEIPVATSLTDYIFRWLALKFLTEKERTEIGINSPE